MAADRTFNKRVRVKIKYKDGVNRTVNDVVKIEYIDGMMYLVRPNDLFFCVDLATIDDYSIVF